MSQPTPEQYFLRKQYEAEHQLETELTHEEWLNLVNPEAQPTEIVLGTSPQDGAHEPFVIPTTPVSEAQQDAE